LTGGDPLDPDNPGSAEDEEREPDPVFPVVRVEGRIPRAKFRDVIDRLDGELERGFRETQKDVLRGRAARLKPGGRFVLLCNVYHGEVPTGLQIAVGRDESGETLVTAEGRGPAMTVVRGVFEEMEVLVEEVRDGVFHREEGVGWVARIPREGGLFLGQEVTVLVEEGWPGVSEEGGVAESAFLQRMMNELAAVLAGVERGFERYVGDEEVSCDVGDPIAVFPAGSGDEEDWYLQISRSNWPGFRWRILFRGEKALDIMAGA
jgi:hypothetical protein